MRLILYLGKGGVGKTTTAAATAVRAAELGHRTLVVSTDVAHSLADALDVPLQSQPTQVAPNLWGQEINVLDEVRRHWGQLQTYLQNVLRRKGVNEVAAEELSVIPGMEEVVSLMHIRRQAREGNFDAVIVDAAPTGETVRLLTMPETFQLYAGRVLNWESSTVKLARPFVRALVPASDVFDSLPKFMAEVEELRATLTNPEISSYRLVLTPERMVLKEAQRAATYLALYGYPVDGAVLNRVLPDDVQGEGFLQRLYAIQQGYRKEAHALFAPLPIWEAPFEARDLRGVEDLSRLGRTLFGAADPTHVFFRGATQELSKVGDEYVLRLPLPHVELNKVNMTKRGDQLFVEIGNFRRELILPLTLADREATRAVFKNGTLEVRFGPPPVRQMTGTA
ncbi:MAG: TRC40/GET3/ArsA family transport-energizing ATPase [Chloroflexota bacterium]|nr:TRC40/GET3/ArsA family transport-energizing ATPase [Chloroflexota bacterium]PLS77699.1 MAG: arsenic-transporting ATPase [Chloroflexota bacterium]